MKEPGRLRVVLAHESEKANRQPDHVMLGYRGLLAELKASVYLSMTVIVLSVPKDN
jgi:hypothetical protein